MMSAFEQIFWLIILSLAVAAISWTVTQEEVFREPREICERRSKNARSLLERKFFYLFTCEYCFSFWAGLFIIIVTGFRLLLDDIRGYMIAFFVLPWVANQWMSLYRRLRVVIKYENALAENEKENGNSTDQRQEK
jgi:hypothetical protein